MQGYSLLENISYAFRKHWRVNKPTVICCGLAVVMRVAQPFIGLLMPKLVIDQIEAKADIVSFLAIVGSAALLLMVVSAIRSYTDMIVDQSVGTLAIFDEMHQFVKKELVMDYELLEDPEVKKVFDKANRGLESNHTLPNNIPRSVVNVLVNLFGLLLYGGVIITIHPLIILLLAVSAGVNWLFLSMARKYYDKNREEESDKRGKFWYMQNALLRPEGSKDIRMYGMNGWLCSTMDSFMEDTMKVSRRINWRNTRAALVDALLILLRDGAAYAYLVYLLLVDRITIGNFVLVFAAISGFAGWVSALILQTSDLLKASSEMNDIRAYYLVPDRFNTGKGEPVSLDHAPGIRLTDVGYTYPNLDTPVLEGIDVDIAPGERIAIVGANGAGKTTIIKLICGLYKPKTGVIEIDGIDSSAFNRDEYYTMFSPVFQEIHILAESIAQNVSQAPLEQTDLSRVIECLKKSTLYEKVYSLPNKELTMMARTIHEDAVELSGGEMQKLALARALYKNAPVIILDEPTAALDPIAESEVYAQYAELTEGKTSIYISHWLASTRFCNRILFIDGHRIAEQGSHDELMALNGKYAEMFNIQAHYYREGNVNTEQSGL
ncbi:MAG: ABC transporter ATP-binding protein/permease [Treponema sp.]|jgi:ABC-type multidrug transport system fused ATPase/permease subunit|nr:ABC transporter ATP-binding protein/permease [Treponema sp.]